MNAMKIEFRSRSENEAFARVSVAAFASQLDPTIEDLTDIKTVVSEVVTNAIIHGYNSDPNYFVTIRGTIIGDTLCIEIEDEGKGMEDIELARTPLYTSKPELERSGMGFTIIENFMDEVHIDSKPGQGTKIAMKKQIKSKKTIYN